VAYCFGCSGRADQASLCFAGQSRRSAEPGDNSASVEESRRLAQRLGELGRPVELRVIPGAFHVFNFRDRRQAVLAWDATMAFLDRRLRPKGRSLGLKP
jgi:acetyl esterase/lipase